MGLRIRAPVLPSALRLPLTLGPILGAGLVLGLGAPAAAQGVSPMPIAPEVVARDDEGNTTVRATRLTQGIQLDGRLDEEIYRTVPPIRTAKTRIEKSFAVMVPVLQVARRPR